MLSSLIGIFSKKSKSVAEQRKKSESAVVIRSVKNWYADRYVAIILQRNFLLIFAIIASISVLVALIVVKTMYEQRSIDPYILDVDPTSGIVTIVDYESTKSYTAQEIVKESLILQYIRARETYDEATNDDRRNLVRVMSARQIYEMYLKDSSGINAVRSYGRDAKANIKIRGSLNYITQVRVQVRFSKIISASNKQDTKEKRYSVVIGFSFLDSQGMPLDDRHLNPLGFQVNSYILQEEVREGDE